jgi:cytochrome c peroxidase
MHRYLAAAIALAVAVPGVASAEPSLADLKAQYRRPASVPAPANNPVTAEKVDLGKTLFFDPRHSGAGNMSCATCHNPARGWGDGLATGIGAGEKHLGRRSPTIINAAWGEIFMWDGRKESLEDQALGPIQADVEMNKKIDELVGDIARLPRYQKMFKAAFPGEAIGAPTIAKAIASYERTVVSGEAPFDRWIAGDENAISEDAKRGFKLFNGKANCAACHKSWRFTDDSFHDIGVHSKDRGRAAVVEGAPIELEHAFKTPGLREIALRGPYMHDGSVPTLEAVVYHYASGFAQRESVSGEIKPFKVSKSEVADLVAFMRTLTGKGPAVTVPVLPTSEE